MSDTLHNKVAVITGGTGTIGRAIAESFIQEGATVVLLARKNPDAVANELRQQYGGDHIGITADVLDAKSLTHAHETIREQLGQIDILVNGAGGNAASATVNVDQSFFDIPAEAYQQVVNLNFLGTLLPCQVFGKAMVDQQSGVIMNIASMAAVRPLTRVIAYSAAKAAVTNFTQWLAVHMATEYSPNIRVNAIAPGFFVGQQNRKLLYDADNQLSARGQQIIDHTPMGRFGEMDDLLGVASWLCGDGAKFITGIVVPVDGGFSAFGGV